ncbi:MAG TPA: hypothetical protein VK843_21600 [Planctomycetota bacterium]|nr:hypothetical protein [Planctomycetota bacterium]
MLLGNLLFALLLQDVVGLREGESANPGAKDSALLLGNCAIGRLIDGTSGLPVAGAALELWTEGDASAPQVEARDTSRSDGSFRLEGGRGDKVLIRAAGYRSNLIPVSDCGEILLLPAAKHLGLRVTDLDGKPIAGARAESRQTCAHAPPAFVSVSSESGAFDFLMFPPLDDNPEIVVTAHGYGAVFLGDPDLLLAPNGLELRLPRRRPIRFQVVDEQGKPIADRGVSLGGEPRWNLTRTDSSGRAVFESPFLGRDELLEIECEGKPVHLASGRIPSTIEPVFTFRPPDFTKPAPALDESKRVPLHVVDAQGKPVAMRVGVVNASSNLDTFEFLSKDWGPSTLVAGGAFSGWTETVKTLDAPVETTLAVKREPVIEIRLPEGESWLLHVQVGDDSLTLENPELPLRQSVPAGKPITVCAVSNKETRLAHLGHIEDDCGLDMTRAGCVAHVPSAGGTSVAHRISAPGIAFSGHVRTQSGQTKLNAVDGAVEFEIDSKAGFECLLGADAAVPRVVGPWDAAVTTVHFARRGSLRVRGDARALFAGGDEGSSSGDGGFLVESLAPGPLIAEIVRQNGEVVEVSLTLAEGEQRELTLR